MIRTSQEIETYLPPLTKSLNLEGEPKWVLLRFLINISLSIDSSQPTPPETTSGEGREYRLEQITGEGKGVEDVTKFYWDAIEAYDSIVVTSKKELEDRLQQHIFRGFYTLKTSLKQNSNIFEWLVQEF
ncbi:MAG: DndE family protein [Campylobacterales bacterium]